MGTGNGGMLTLQQAIELAQENNPDMQGVRAETEAARAEIIRARAAFLPQIDAAGGVEHTLHQPLVRVAPNVFGNPNEVDFPLAQRTVPYVNATLEQSIYDFGRSTNRYREAKASANIQRSREDLFSQDLSLMVVEAYLRVLLAEKDLAVAESIRRAYDSHYATTHKLFQNGAAPRNDLLTAEVARSRAELDLQAAQHEQTIASLHFEKIVGAPPRRLDAGALAVRGLRHDLDESIAQGKQQRTEISMNESERTLAEAQRAHATSEYLPKVYAQAQVLYRDDDYLSPKHQVRLVAGMRWPIFDGLAAYGARKKAQSSLVAAAYRKESLMNDIEVEVTRAHLDLDQAHEALEVSRKNEASAEENLRTLNERYAVGDAPASEVLDAISTLRSASYDKMQALYSINMAIARFQRATGDRITGDHP